MSSARFRGVVLPGHKEHAVEVPFDPATRWDVAARQIRPGRRGVAVHAAVNDVAFDSHVVARAKKFWLLLPAAVQKRAQIAVRDEVAVTLQSQR